MIDASLRIFQTEGDPLEKMRDIAFDLAHNVTGIYGREDLIIAFDIIAHSCLAGFRSAQGLIVSDKGCGKTRTFRLLSEYYQRPIFYPYGSLGVAPPVFRGRSMMVDADQGMLTIDMERGNRGCNILKSLREMRTSGIATFRTRKPRGAAARLLWSVTFISNENNPLRRLDGGCKRIISRVVSQKEDLDLFDFIVMASREDISEDAISREAREKVEFVYAKRPCMDLMKWAWTREIVEFRTDQEAPDRIRVIAAAIAARTYSTKDGEILLVEDRHIKAANDILHSWGAGAYMEGRYLPKAEDAELTDEEIKFLLDTIAPFGSGFPRLLLRLERFRLRDFADTAGIRLEEAEMTVRVLVAGGGVFHPVSYLYRLTPAFTRILREREINNAA